MRNKNNGLLLLTIGLFIILFFTKVFQHGLFFDGLIYSALSNNLANGTASFWAPQFSQTILNSFFEHPPLLFGLEASFMSLFNGAFYAEKLFSFVMACAVVVLIALVWRRMVKTNQLKSLFWLPVLCWIITPKNSWTFTNNLLENVLTVLTLWSIYLLIIALKKEGIRRILVIVFSGVIIGFAVLTKGPPALFPLGFFFLYFMVFHKEYRVGLMLRDSIVLCVSLVLFFTLLFALNKAALDAFTQYLNIQVFDSIAGKGRVGSRLVLMKNLFFELLPLLLILLIFLGVYWKKRKHLFSDFAYFRALIFLCFIGLSASVPLMISPKLSSFYLVPALPYFALAFAIILAPYLLHITAKLEVNKVWSRVIQLFGVCAIVAGLALTTVNSNTVGRDHDIIHDLALIKTKVAPHSVISISQVYNDDWTTIAYLQRYNQISVDFTDDQHVYFLSEKDSPPMENYDLVNLDLKKYSLFQRTN